METTHEFGQHAYRFTVRGTTGRVVLSCDERAQADDYAKLHPAFYVVDEHDGFTDTQRENIAAARRAYPNA